MGLEGAELVGVVIGGLLLASWGGDRRFVAGLVLALLLWTLRLWMQGPKVTSTTQLEGKVVVITGANTGIGRETALDLCRRGAKVVMLCRDLEKAEQAADSIRKEVREGEVMVLKLDLASLVSVRECAEQLVNSLDKIDILINNAGVMMCPEKRTKEGFEMQFGTNHLGHFLLTNLLLPLIKKAAPGARVITVSSLAHEKGRMQWDDLNWEKTPYSPNKAYSQSKLANVLFTKELARKTEGSGVTTYSLHPGVINTELGRHMGDTYGILAGVGFKIINWFTKTPEAGSRTTIYCAVEESISEQTGRYYSDCAEKRPAAQSESEEDAARLWAASKALTEI